MLVGSEGTLAIVTKVWVRLTPNPQDYRTMRAIFDTVDDATNAVSEIIAAGIIPGGHGTDGPGHPAAVEEAFHFGFPLDAGAVLVIEVDGPAAGLDGKQQQIVEFCRATTPGRCLQATTAEERELLWKCRKMAVGAVGRLSPSYMIQDGVVPRTRLPHILRRIAEIGRKYSVRIVNVAHAGDGNVHPILLFDERDRGQVERVLAAGREIAGRVHRLRRQRHRRARHRRGEDRLHAEALRPGRPGGDAPVRQAFDPTMRLNPGKIVADEWGGKMKSENPYESPNQVSDPLLEPVDKGDYRNE